MFDNYADAVAFIHGRTKFKKIPTLSRMRTFLKALGDPQDRVIGIHVAGTNGKGSTVAFLRDLLMASGKTVGTFTSPFLIKFNERISVDGQPISDAEILRLVNVLKPVIDHLDATLPEGGPTEFEIITAMMFYYFGEGHADVVVVEVGLGGLLDSTNVFTPKVSAITTIGYDHMHILGNTLSEIAGQKAGIIKHNVPVVVGNVPDDAAQVISDTAAREQAPIYRWGTEFVRHLKPTQGWQETFDYQGLQQNLKGLSIKLLGDYQADNAAVALTAFILFEQQAHLPIDAKSIRHALAQTSWPGRFEPLSDQPLIVIDGAHNQPAVTELSQLLTTKFKQVEIYLVFAVLDDKQHRKMLQILGKIPNVHLLLTNFTGPNSRQSASLQELTAELPAQAHAATFTDWQLAIGTALQSMSADDLLLITGSLYFISDVRKFFTEME